MAYQNINQYNFRKLLLSPVREISDISLASDERDFNEEVIFSPLLIGEEDGNRMPIKIDFNSPTIIQPKSFDKDTIVSENYWNPTDTDPNLCVTASTLCDVGLTGIDNGLVRHMSGETIEITTGLYLNDNDKFSRYKYDRRFKMHPITGFTTTENRLWNDNSYTYNITYGAEPYVGYYTRLQGGFYQGFYKLAGYEYEVLPERQNLGWTAEFVLRYRWTGDTEVGLNKRYPQNKGTFFYLGARAENKFYHYPDGSPKTDSGYTRVTEGLSCMKTCECSLSGSSDSSCFFVYQMSGEPVTNCACTCPCECTTTAEFPELDPLYDGVSNGMSIRFSGDTGNPKICVKTYRITGECLPESACTTNLTYVTGTSVTEWCSAKGIFDDCADTPYIDQERWVQIDAVFRRNAYFDECDLWDKGGLGTITKEEYIATLYDNSLSLVSPPITQEQTKPPTTEVIDITDKWIQERNYRLGTFRIYVNGRVFMEVADFEEIIPRPLNTFKEKQIGVPFNISLGGGTQGLHDNLTFSGGCPSTIEEIVYQQDPECLTTYDLDNTIYAGLKTEIRLEEIFGGSFIGDISFFNMYIEPLDASEIRHNFNLLKDRFQLLDFYCIDCNPTPIVPPTECDIVISIIPNPTPTMTPTVTPTEMMNITPTQTSNPTNTPTISPSQTPTQTNTPTLSPTVTQTPTQTNTPTLSPTVTQTNTPTLTSTPTPTLPIIFEVCNCILNLNNGEVYEYDVQSNTYTYLVQLDNSDDIAMTNDKLWIYSSTNIKEYDITLNPWTINFNRNISITTSVYGPGLTAKNNSELIIGNKSIYLLDITSNVANETKLFDLPSYDGSDCEVTGDIFYSATTNTFLITYQNNINKYIGHFMYDGTLLTEQNITGISDYAYGIFYKNNTIYILDYFGDVFSVNPNSLSLTFVQKINFSTEDVGIFGASQPISCLT